MALPALGALRAALPDAFLAIAALPSITPVFEEITDARPQQLLAISKANERAELGAGQFDTVLLLTNSFRTAWAARGSGISERWGYAAGVRGPLLTRAVARPTQEIHQSEYYLQLVRGLGFDAPSSAPSIRVSDATRQRARNLLAQQGIQAGDTIVGFAPGAAYGHAKRWPPDRVAAVVTRLAQENGARAVLLGAPADRDAGRAIESSVRPALAVVNLIGRTDLRLLMGVLHECRAFVSNDSGAMHLAAALGIPVTALFGPTKEHVTAPVGDQHDILRHHVFCSPCMLRECPIDHRCMKRITVDEVHTAVTRRLAR